MLLPFAIGITGATVASGAAIDYANLLRERSQLQAAVDAAVIAGARDTSSNWQTVARNTMLAQFETSEASAIASTFTRGSDGKVTGHASRNIGTFFGGLLGINEVLVAVDAAAQIPVSTTNVCILAKSTTASPGLLVNSGANVNAPNCRIDVASTASPAATFNAGSNINVQEICVAGSNLIDNGGSHPTLKKACSTITDPFAGKLPAPTSTNCTMNGGNWNGGTVNISPGVYCGWYNLNNAPTVNFAPGLYVIKGGGINVNGGTWNGNGVTFYFADSSMIQFNSGVRTYLKAPTTGNYAGLLFYEPTGLSNSNFILNNAAGHDLEGLIYLPSRNLTVNSGATTVSDDLSIVVNTIIFNSMTWSLAPSTLRPMTANGNGGSSNVFLSN